MRPRMVAALVWLAFVATRVDAQTAPGAARQTRNYPELKAIMEGPVPGRSSRPVSSTTVSDAEGVARPTTTTWSDVADVPAVYQTPVPGAGQAAVAGNPAAWRPSTVPPLSLGAPVNGGSEVIQTGGARYAEPRQAPPVARAAPTPLPTSPPEDPLLPRGQTRPLFVPKDNIPARPPVVDGASRSNPALAAPALLPPGAGTTRPLRDIPAIAAPALPAPAVQTGTVLADIPSAPPVVSGGRVSQTAQIQAGEAPPGVPSPEPAPAPVAPAAPSIGTVQIPEVQPLPQAAQSPAPAPAPPEHIAPPSPMPPPPPHPTPRTQNKANKDASPAPSQRQIAPPAPLPFDQPGSSPSPLFCDKTGCADIPCAQMPCDYNPQDCTRPFDPLCPQPDPCGKFLPFGMVGVKPGNQRVIGLGEVFVPVWQDAESLLFADFSGEWDDTVAGTGFFGLGYRTFVDPCWIFGLYGYYDLLATNQSNVFNQANLGIELMSLNWDFRVNGYFPASGGKSAITYGGISNGTVVTNNFVERAYGGFDFEIGNRFLYWGWNDRYQLHWFLGAYYFENKAPGFTSFAGPKARLEMRMFDLGWLGEQSRVELGMEVLADHVRNEQVYGYLRVRIPFGGKSGRALLDPLRRRMVDTIVHPID